MVRKINDISVGDAMRMVLGALPDLEEARVSTGPSEGGFDRNASSPMGTW